MDDDTENYIELSCDAWEKPIRILESEARLDFEWPKNLGGPYKGPFPGAGKGSIEIEVEGFAFAGLFSLPTAKVLLHPIVRNYYHVQAIEQRLNRVAVAHAGYVELVPR